MRSKERKPNRLGGYDYSQNGYYFVTVCVQNRQEYFGKIEDGEILLNEYGVIAERIWVEIPQHFEYISLDEFKIMPNHVHGIIIVGNVGNRHACSLQKQKRQYQAIPVVVGSYKSAVTRNIRQMKTVTPDFVWQKSFYDHIIRDEISLNRIREYIRNNPLQWDTDVENIKNRRNDNSVYYNNIIKV